MRQRPESQCGYPRSNRATGSGSGGRPVKITRPALDARDWCGPWTRQCWCRCIRRLPAALPPPLVLLAKKEGIELLTHRDCTDILPEGTLRELLGTGLQGAGVLAEKEGGEGEEPGCGEERLRGELVPQWVVKYTAVVKDRGVIENKGYFAGAELIAG